MYSKVLSPFTGAWTPPSLCAPIRAFRFARPCLGGQPSRISPIPRLLRRRPGVHCPPHQRAAKRAARKEEGRPRQGRKPMKTQLNGPGLSRFVRKKRPFLLDRPRPVFFSARRKENGGRKAPFCPAAKGTRAAGAKPPPAKFPRNIAFSGRNTRPSDKGEPIPCRIRSISKAQEKTT